MSSTGNDRSDERNGNVGDRPTQSCPAALAGPLCLAGLCLAGLCLAGLLLARAGGGWPLVA